MQFQRPQHAIIHAVLQSMDTRLLERSRCYLGDGTAIVLMHAEYRLSVDVDFLCADTDGYRELRSAIVEHGAPALFGPDVKTIREFRSDHYGIRGILSLADQPIKVEFVREGRMPLEGDVVDALGVPVLSSDSQFAEKLLANADRCLDTTMAYRDAIDLAYLVGDTGIVPRSAIATAERAYGKHVQVSLGSALEQLAKPAEAEHASTLQMQIEDVTAATRRLRDATASAWPDAAFPEILATDSSFDP